MAKENYKPVKPEDLKKPRMADIDFHMSLSDHAFIQQIDPRRRPEINDARLIQEDHTAMANLPMKEINRQFTPGKYSPHYWMESEVRPEGVIRFNEPEDE